jgi:hypothetical protein
MKKSAEVALEWESDANGRQVGVEFLRTICLYGSGILSPTILILELLSLFCKYNRLTGETETSNRGDELARDNQSGRRSRYGGWDFPAPGRHSNNFKFGYSI